MGQQAHGRSGDVDQGVFGAEGIGNVLIGNGIVIPLAIHDEAIRILAGDQGHGGEPNAFWRMHHWYRLVFPSCKIADEFDGAGPRGFQSKCHFFDHTRRQADYADLIVAGRFLGAGGAAGTFTFSG